MPLRQNDVSEFYTLIKFLRIKPYNMWERFNEHIAKPVKSGRGANGAMKKLHVSCLNQPSDGSFHAFLQVVLSCILLRRRKDQHFNGKILIELPKRTIEIVSCPFNDSEQQFYASLEMKMDSALQKLIKSDGGSAYMSILLLLLRLRQGNFPFHFDSDYIRMITIQHVTILYSYLMSTRPTWMLLSLRAWTEMTINMIQTNSRLP